MFVEFFIRRPVFASVCSLLIVLAGAICIPSLPIAQYPELAPPQVVVTATYTGASAEVLESAVTTPLEQQINGVEGMKYMQSTSTNDGVSTITVTFDVDRDPDLAAVDVQNRVSQATGRLPNEVKVTGVSVKKNSAAFVLGIAFYAENDVYDNVFVSNYVDQYVKDEVKRVKGVGDVPLFGERKYSMRLWLDPARLATRQLTAGDVVRALQDQNVQVAAGQIGQQPAVSGQQFQVSVRAIGRLKDAEEFNDLVVKSTTDGTLVRLRDVGHAELGAEDYSLSAIYRNVPSIGMGVLQLPGANALDVAHNVKAELERLSKSFPPGLKYKVAFDSTPFVEDSIKDVVETLAVAIVLVIATIFLFLATWRSTFIPAITIPVSLVGTFAFVKAFGFTINTLTLFGITLATGLVVDDAIVVIENIERFMREKHMGPREAAGAAMKEVFGAVVATSLVLIAVFVPMAFFPGTTGRIYRQFSVTIAISVAISAFNAITLTPALCALLLRPHGKVNAFFERFERMLDRVKERYGRLLRTALRWRGPVTVAFVISLGVTYWMSRVVPTGFVPEEDQGYFIVAAQTPEGSSLEYTSKVFNKATDVLIQQPEVAGAFAAVGYGFAGNGANKGVMWVMMKPFAERRGEQHSVASVIARTRGQLFGIPEGFVVAFPPPPIQGIGNLGGFQFEVLDRGGSTLQQLAGGTWGLIGAGSKEPQLKGLFSTYSANDPQLVVEVDRGKARAMNVRLDEVFSTLQVFMGSQYVNDFDFSNRSYRVYVQADARFRAQREHLSEFYVRSESGQMIPLGTLINIRETVAPQVISHYNLFRSAEINGTAGDGFSSGQAIEQMEKLAAELPNTMTFQWSGLSLEELEGGKQTTLLFGLGLLVVFLVLAAQYESFALPFIVLLGVPVAVLGALGAQWARGLQNDVFCQVGLVMLIGLSSKNAILIVEFAQQLRERGESIIDAAVVAAQTRLRPILMTSLAFILGGLPLVFASGAGRAARHSLGTAVLGGMIVSTILNLLLIPVLYVLIESVRERRRAPKTESIPPTGGAEPLASPAE
ncbi:multidrug efflux RND transporter permease subunit [Pendulispora brunnea]|uniref:Multidrug efflux RND transporter permease subunit n=1 Tax=Pendulispora brunnea TaxID=2905690 RepID=A0ABZ2KET2_9BACT